MDQTTRETIMSQFQLLLQATRARTLPVMLAPVLVGSVLAWQQGTPFQWGLFLLTLLGAFAAHLGANVVNDVFDFAEGYWHSSDPGRWHLA